MVLEYISGTNGWDRRVVSQNCFIKALLEFQLSGINIKTNFVQSILTKWYRKVPCKIIRWSFLILKSPKNIVIAFKCVLITLIQSIKLKKYPYAITTHNDLFYFNNIITGYDKHIYIYDFEYVMLEKKWILIDIIDICFNLSTLRFDTKLFDEYIIHLFRQQLLFHNTLKNLNGQVRVILIRKILGVLLSNSIDSKQKINCRRFLKNILLSERNYYLWYSININPYFKLY